MKINTIILILCCLISCADNKDNYKVAFKISEKDLIPEGITYSSNTKSFYLGSLFKSKIIKIDENTGKFYDFAVVETKGMKILGLLADDERNLLWACGNLRNQNQNLSVIYKFNIKDGQLLKSYTFEDTLNNTYNDLAQMKNGDIYFTDSNNKSIYKIDYLTDSVNVFLDSDEISHPNGITISPDEKYIYAASDDKGIRIIDVKTKKILNAQDVSGNSTGIDGLKFYKNSLIGLQNEVKRAEDRKIIRFSLDKNYSMITSMEVIDKGNKYFDIPTTVVINKNKLYCLATSQMAQLDGKTSSIRDYNKLTDNIILEYQLE